MLESFAKARQKSLPNSEGGRLRLLERKSKFLDPEERIKEVRDRSDRRKKRGEKFRRGGK